GTVEPGTAGPKRPQDRVPLRAAKQAMAGLADVSGRPVPVSGTDYALTNGSVVIAAITSCTNTSNPSAMVAAGLLAKAARERGLERKPWVKTSLAPGSQVVTDYLDAAHLTRPLNELGFHLVGYGCTTCIGNSGPLDSAIVEAIERGDGLTVSAVLSGNRNFEGRIHPNVRANWLASPALVVAYAIAGTMDLDLTSEPLGTDPNGDDVFLRDLWPDNADIQSTIAASLKPEMFRRRYGAVFEGSAEWQTIAATGDPTYRWHDESTYVRRPPFFDGMTPEPAPVSDVRNARALLMLGDSVTTDHISPAGAIRADGPAGEWLSERQVRPVEFNSFGARRGNHEIMLRGTFGNIRIRNELAPGTEGGFTRHQPSGEILSVYAAAERYRSEDVPLIVIAGREYGTGSSRDWAAKGTRLLGVRAVIAESFERIHRTNLIGMGVLPLVFEDGVTRQDLGLDGTEMFDVSGLDGGIEPRDRLKLTVLRADGSRHEFTLRSRVDTSDEAEHFRNGGILLTVLRRMAQAA
ncbi:MAG: aconitate hydratase AcnA, partial [Rhodospirillales bacterium]|nr:aconitate hydratase AcnA [Rhodospirillales bacterium]